MRNMYATMLLAVVLAPVFAQSDDGARALIERAIKAHGGGEALAKHPAGQSKTRGTVFLPMGEASFTQEASYHLPGRIKEVMEIESGGNKLSIISVYNGDKSWMKVRDKFQELDDKMLAELREAAHVAQLCRLTGLLDKANVLTMLDEIKVNNRPALGVKVATKGYRDLKLYFDRGSGYLVKAERQAFDIAAKRLTNEERFFSDWKDVEGIKTPMKIVVLRDGKKFMEADASEVKAFDKLPDNFFDKP
jgi:hypothetical protein